LAKRKRRQAIEEQKRKEEQDQARREAESRNMWQMGENAVKCAEPVKSDEFREEIKVYVSQVFDRDPSTGFVKKMSNRFDKKLETLSSSDRATPY